MFLQNKISKSKKPIVNLREEIQNSSDSSKHDLNFADLKGDLHNKEILCFNDDDILKGQIGKGTFKCEYCDFNCSWTGDLKLHIPSHFQISVKNIKSYCAEDYLKHNENIYKCHKCGAVIVFTKSKTNQNQIQIYQDDSNDSCEECNNKLIKVGDISKIVKDNNSNKIHTCPYCEIKFTNSEDLYEHMEQHNVDQELLYPDSEIENVARDINNDSSYLKSVIVKQGGQCMKHEKQLSTSEENINVHKKIKITKKEKDKVNITQNNQSSKKSAHFRPYVCSKCPFRAFEENTLAKHIATHYIQKKFACLECSYKGMTAKSLQGHLKTHTGEKPFGCSQCQYRTSTRANLRRHERQHTGEKPFACTKCDYSAAQKKDLQNHMKSSHS